MNTPFSLFKKGFIFFLLSLFAVFSVPTAFASVTVDLKNSVFSDLATDDANFNAIYFLKNTGVIEGYTSADSDLAAYKPDNAINRAEFLKILYMEEFLERDDLIENGEAGLQKIIDVLNPDGGFFFGWVA